MSKTEERASGIYPESAKQAWLDGPTAQEVIVQLREMLTRSGLAHSTVIGERNKFQAALEEVRDRPWTSRAEMRDHATTILKPPKGKS